MFVFIRDLFIDKARYGRMDVILNVFAWISLRECISVLLGNELVDG